MFTIRPFENTDHDYEALVAVSNAAWPDEPTTVEIQRYNDDNRNPKYLTERVLLETGDKQIVAEGIVWESQWSYVPGKYGLTFNVHPDWEGEGLEEQLYAYLVNYLNQRELKPTILDTFTRTDRAQRMRFWENHGFKIILRENASAIDIQDYDYSRFAGVHEKVTSQGVELLTLAELKTREPDWQQKCYDLLIPIEDDVPSPDDQTPQPLEEFAKTFNHPNHLPDAFFVAVDNGQWVGISNLKKDPVRKNRLYVGITGILRSHRRRGIATALKLLTFKYAQNYGARYIETGNEENNPMYDLNVMLGFTPLPAWLDYRKLIKE